MLYIVLGHILASSKSLACNLLGHPIWPRAWSLWPAPRSVGHVTIICMIAGLFSVVVISIPCKMSFKNLRPRGFLNFLPSR